MAVRPILTVIVSAVLVGGALAGCGANPGGEPAPAAPTDVVSDPAAGGPRAVAIGEPFDIYGAQFTVGAGTITAIRAVTDCSEATKYVSTEPKAGRGALIAVDLEVEATQWATTQDFGSVSAADFSRLDPQGYETDVEPVDPSAQWCEPQDAQFDVMTPGSKQRGTVVLDVDSADGTLVFAPRFLVKSFQGVKVPLQTS